MNSVMDYIVCSEILNQDLREEARRRLSLGDYCAALPVRRGVKNGSRNRKRND